LLWDMEKMYGAMKRPYLIFRGNWHHWTRWFHPRVWKPMWHATNVWSLVVNAFHGMEKFVLTFRRQPMDDYHEFKCAHEIQIGKW
jgi:hypothetical protein